MEFGECDIHIDCIYAAYGSIEGLCGYARFLTCRIVLIAGIQDIYSAHCELSSLVMSWLSNVSTFRLLLH